MKRWKLRAAVALNVPRQRIDRRLPSGRPVAAVGVLPGDRVWLAGCWIAVKEVCSGRYPTGVPAAVLVFDAGSAWWPPELSHVLVERGEERVPSAGGRQS
ncbi:hypothetical protein LRS74_15735 [Streptomyces sp. LX-29]|uniref:hypothetical protein n=1 Tax=Streptomyces sp. LX-29 TaxID=2900152 RepID=UPI00240E7D60|nr:hypothetical protein [Streptomyces sp. LX-29]WFB08343.1 hypothetical protein LRS74_15735 [Streptomyces sp. LX-29]